MNAEFLRWLFVFYRAVSVEDALYLAVTGDAAFNTTYSMGTSTMMLQAALLWTYTSLYSTIGVCTVLNTAVRVDAALFTAVGVCAVLHTAVRVDAAPYNAVGVDVAFPLYCGWRMGCPLYCC